MPLIATVKDISLVEHNNTIIKKKIICFGRASECVNPTSNKNFMGKKTQFLSVNANISKLMPN